MTVLGSPNALSGSSGPIAPATKTNDLVTAQKTVTGLTAERDQAQAAAKTAVEELKGVVAKIGNVVPFHAKQQLDSAMEILQ